ncbi:glucose PTS transporter subunit IIA [Vibrio olivae]
MFATWFQVRIEKCFPKQLPDFADKWLGPFFGLLFTVPLTFLLIGPFSVLLANFISSGVFTLYHASPMIAGLLIGAIWQILVVFGIHWCLVPVALNNITVNGYDVLLPLFIPAVFGQMGACLGVLLKTKDRKVRGYAGPAAMTAMFGITEPAIYGITLPRKWPFIFGCMAGALGGGIIASFQTKAYSMGLLSLFSFAQIISPQGLDISVIACLLATILTIIVAATLTYFFSPSEKPSSVCLSSKIPKQQEKPQFTRKGTRQDDVASPLSGEVIPLSLVSDPTFASGVMGEGIAIIPDSGTLVAPFAGTVSSVFKTQHAMGIKSTTGIELLIHIGIDTVKLDGQGFKLLVEQDQEVTLGEPLIEFDLDFSISRF